MGKRPRVTASRELIGKVVVDELVSKSLPHLIYYSFQVKNFVFVSRRKHNTISPRIVLQQDTNEGILNVVVVFCHIASNKYEVTVYTAMVVKRFQNWRWAVFCYDRSRLFYPL